MLFQRPTTDLYLAHVMSGWTAWVGGDLPGTKFATPALDECKDGQFGERSISDCHEPFAVFLTGTERVVLRHAPRSNNGTVFLFSFQPLLFVLIKSQIGQYCRWLTKIWRGLLPPSIHQGFPQTPTKLHGVTIPKATVWMLTAFSNSYFTQ